MLTDLEIQRLGIIDHVSLALAPGLNVLSGETGAGKTMVVTGLQWLLGARADKDKVRVGADAAMVQARFDFVPDSALEWSDPDDDELLVSREVGGRGEDGQSAGRSRARVAGRLAPVAALGEVLLPVVEIHTQHESVRLGDAAVQRGLLDRYAGAEVQALLPPYTDAYNDWRQATAALQHAQESSQDDAREADRLRFEVAEITAVEPAQGEEDRLDSEIGRLQHAESLRSGSSQAGEYLTGEGGARDGLGSAVAAIREVAAHDPDLTPPLQRLEGVMAELQDVAFELADYADNLDSDPANLDRTLERRAAIGGLLRKYGPTTEDVLAYRRQAEERLDLVDGGEERLALLRDAVQQAQTTMLGVGTALRDARRVAAQRLAAIVDGHLAELSMPHARTTILVEEAPPGPHGCDRIEFLLAANRGQPALPLGGAASGGERSRVALAVKVALADADDTPVMVFDEVDAGIGGETAQAVGRKLARLARGRQVLCVTHLAQLAAFADAHFVVTKHSQANQTVTTVARLAPQERVAELSRMLSGDNHTTAALSHAQELLDMATAEQDGPGTDTASTSGHGPTVNPVQQAG
ncbi:MAG: DNA repair protein RecN [Euzebya sp.]